MTDLETRMRAYEENSNLSYDSSSPLYIRVDGHGFSKFTRSFKKPYDDLITEGMNYAAKREFGELNVCRLAYTQSDEITFVLWNVKGNTEPYPQSGRTQKLASLVASHVTLFFNEYLSKHIDANDPLHLKIFEPYFDGRVVSIAKEEVPNYIFWRALDSTRNSIQTVARWTFGHKAILNKNSDMMIKMLADKNIDIYQYCLAGRIFYKNDVGCVQYDNVPLPKKGFYEYFVEKYMKGVFDEV